ncbi:MAG: response regulator transcription factor [Chloroflexia bacterium]|nr:response regulator transcription factor [Chloroflexia bacterium]
MVPARQRLVIVDDHEVVRLGLRALLEHYPHLQVVGEAASAEEAVLQVARLQPDVVVMDIRLPGRSGVEACREIRQRFPQSQVIMLTSYEEDEAVFEAIAAGASGYVLKQIGSDALVRAIETVARGEALLDPAVTKRVLDQVRSSASERHQRAFSDLTEQELRVLALVSRGLSNKEIASAMGLQEKTVRNYVSAILGKLGLASRVQAATYALKNHIERVVSLPYDF